MEHNFHKIINGITEVENSLGKFSIGGELGNGGTAVVKECWLEGEKTQCFAIKFLKTDISNKPPTEYRRFRQSYINIVANQHLGCFIPFIHLGAHLAVSNESEITIPYIIMGLAEKSLAKEYKVKRISDFDEFKSLFKQLFAITEKIHRIGIIHRDIKPENIFYYDKKWYLADFDISKFSEENGCYVDVNTKANDRLANYGYSAPEQFDKKIGPICCESDWFAVAAVMVWLVTGKLVSRGIDDVSLGMQDVRFKPYEKLFTKLLRQNPEDRLKNLDEIVAFIKEANGEERNLAENRAEKIHQNKVMKCLDEQEVIMNYFAPNWNQDRQTVHIKDIKRLFKKLNDLFSDNNFAFLFDSCDIQNVRDFNKLPSPGNVWGFVSNGIHYQFAISNVFEFYHHKYGASFFIIIGKDMDARHPDKVIEGKDYREERFTVYGRKILPLYVGETAEYKGKLIEIDPGKCRRYRRFLNSNIYILGLWDSPLQTSFNVLSESLKTIKTNLNDLTSEELLSRIGNEFESHEFQLKIVRPDWISLLD